jgi:hypothetical protein
MESDECPYYPHTPAPEPILKFDKMNYHGGKCCCEDYFNCHDCRDDRQFNKEHDAAIARAATLAAQKRLEVLIKTKMWYFVKGEHEHDRWIERINEVVESLRQSAGDEQR